MGDKKEWKPALVNSQIRACQVKGRKARRPDLLSPLVRVHRIPDQGLATAANWREKAYSFWSHTDEWLFDSQSPRVDPCSESVFTNEMRIVTRGETCRVGVSAHDPGSSVGVATHTSNKLSYRKSSGNNRTLGPEQTQVKTREETNKPNKCYVPTHPPVDACGKFLKFCELPRKPCRYPSPTKPPTRMSTSLASAVRSSCPNVRTQPHAEECPNNQHQERLPDCIGRGGRSPSVGSSRSPSTPEKGLAGGIVPHVFEDGALWSVVTVCNVLLRGVIRSVRAELRHKAQRVPCEPRQSTQSQKKHGPPATLGASSRRCSAPTSRFCVLHFHFSFVVLFLVFVSLPLFSSLPPLLPPFLITLTVSSLLTLCSPFSLAPRTFTK